MREKLLFFVSMFIVAFQILVSFPIIIWSHNQFNFSIWLWEAVSIFGYLSIAISVLLLLIAFGTPRKLRSYLFPLFVLGSVLIYLQQNILVWDYGVLDGKRINFSTNDYLGLIDLCLWVFGVIAYILLRRQLVNRAEIILTFIGIVTIAAIIIPMMSYDYNEDNVSASLTENNKFSFSQEKNILLFVLDGFQSDLFWEFIDNDPELKDEFAGFKFYPNTASVFAKTYPTIPLLLTGKKYQKQQSIQEFLDNAYQDSMLTDLIDAGWDVGLYPYVEGTLALDSLMASNYTAGTRYSEKVDNYLQALDLSFFRTVPHYLKSSIYNDGSFIIKERLSGYLPKLDKLLEDKDIVKLPKRNVHHGINFLENLKIHSTVESINPTFRFYHLMFPHEPFLLSRNLKFGRIGSDFQAYREYAYASLTLMINYLKELKRLGVYDNSAIIIAADHGGGEYTNKKYVSKEGRYYAILEDGKAKASGKPLLLVKNYGDDGSLKISSKPVSLLDVTPTIADFAGIDVEGIEGKIIGEIEDGAHRERTYYFYNFTGWDSKYLNDFSIYKIRGDVYDENAWTKTGKLAAEINIDKKIGYMLGSTARYGSDIKMDADYSNAFLVGDHYNYAHSYVVSNNGQIRLSLNLDAPLDADQIYILEVELATNGRTLDISLEANDSVISSFELGDKKYRQIAFIEPKKLKTNDKLDLHLYISGQIGADDALLMSKIILQKSSLAELSNDSVIQFSENLDSYYPNGFWAKESWGRWTSSKESSLYFRTSRDFCKNSYILLNINKFSTDDMPESFEVFFNGEKLEPKYIDKNGSGINYFFDCSQLDTTQFRISRLLLKTNRVVAPSEIGKSADNRKLGIGLVELKFVDAEAKKTSFGNPPGK